MIASFVVSVPLRQMNAACCFQCLSSFPALSFHPLVITAASAAQKVYDFILNRRPEEIKDAA
jgi:hypothetical protein